MFRGLFAAQILSVMCVFALGTTQGLAQKAPAEPASDEQEPAPDQPEAAPEEEVPAGPEEEVIPEEEVPEETPEAMPDLQGMAEARAAIDAAQYALALSSLDSALREGQAQPGQLEEVYRLQGETQVAMGNADAAKEAFTSLLFLNADATLGEFASPKIVAALEEARSELAGAVLKATHSVAPNSRRLEVALGSDPMGMAKKVRLSYPRDDGSVAKLSIPLDEGKAIFDLPAQAKSSVTLAILDRHGNVLALWLVDDLPAPIAVLGLEGEGGSSAGNQQIWTRWWVWAGASGAVMTAGVILGVAANGAQDDLDEVVANPGEHSFGEAQSLEDKARSRALWANISFVAAAALGVTSGVMYWRGRNAEASMELAPAADGSGASIIMRGSF